MNKKSILLSGIFATALCFNSCKKEQIENEGMSGLSTMSSVQSNPLLIKYLNGIDLSKVRFYPTTNSDFESIQMIDKITEVFKEIYKKDKNILLVNLAIKSGIYVDETIFLC